MNDITEQLARITRRYVTELDPDEQQRTRARQARAYSAATRYANNIIGRPSYERAWYSGPRQTAEDFNRAMARANSIQYARSTYMGLRGASGGGK
jgi:hypothetical protein